MQAKIQDQRGFEKSVDLLLGKFGLWFAAATLTLALGVMAIQVFSRYLLGHSLVWAEELARYALIWSSMVGSAVAYRQAGHISVTYLLDRIPESARSIVQRLIHVITMLFSMLVLWQGWFLTLRNFKREQLSPALQVHIAWAYLALPVGGLLLAVAAIEALIGRKVPINCASPNVAEETDPGSDAQRVKAEIA